MGNGEQSVMILGILMMLELHVGNLVIHMLFELFMAVMFLMVLDRFGWMMSDVLEVNKI
jgi:hypothetical protein